MSFVPSQIQEYLYGDNHVHFCFKDHCHNIYSERKCYYLDGSFFLNDSNLEGIVSKKNTVATTLFCTANIKSTY